MHTERVTGSDVVTDAVQHPSLEARVGEDVVRLFLAHWRGSLFASALFTPAAAFAGRDYVSTSTAVVWCALAYVNYLGQAFVCWRLEQAPSLSAAVPRWMPWLLAWVACSGVVWGSVPWLLSSAGASVQLFASLFILMLFFAVVNAPSTRAMPLAALPMPILTILALVVHGGVPYVAFGVAVAFGLVLLYGLRVQAAVQLIQKERHAAKDLAEALRRQQQRLAEVENQRTLLLEQMRAAKEGAEQANRSKTTFIAAASHDLRQPAHALGLYMAALIDDELNPAQHDLVQRMHASLGVLNTMFNALLDISRMDAGAVIPRLRTFALAPLLHRLAAEFAPQAAERHLRLSVRLSGAPPAMHPGLHARSDPLLVERIVRNVLGNAVKYTLNGGVLLSCRPRGEAASRRWVIEVWDTGPGIAEADRERVFDEFYQVGNPERNRLAGLGLGLSIVRRLAALLGHRLALFSRPGHGSRILLELPCTDDAAPGPAADDRQGKVAGLVVAVIDDDPDVRSAMQLLLDRWGCRVLVGADAADVLRWLQAPPEPPTPVPLHAIVADYRLRGGRTGIEAIAVLRAACGHTLPAMLVSGDSSPEQLALMRASGLACMSKPVRPARLRDWLVAVAAGDSVHAGSPLGVVDEEMR